MAWLAAGQYFSFASVEEAQHARYEAQLRAAAAAAAAAAAGFDQLQQDAASAAAALKYLQATQGCAECMHQCPICSGVISKQPSMATKASAGHQGDGEHANGIKAMQSAKHDQNGHVCRKVPVALGHTGTEMNQKFDAVYRSFDSSARRLASLQESQEVAAAAAAVSAAAGLDRQQQDAAAAAAAMKYLDSRQASADAGKALLKQVAMAAQSGKVQEVERVGGQGGEATRAVEVAKEGGVCGDLPVDDHRVQPKKRLRSDGGMECQASRPRWKSHLFGSI